MPDSPWQNLARAMADARALAGTSSLLQWDQETYMPPRGGTARAEQLATIQGLLHERLTDPAVAAALAAAEAEATQDPDRAAILRALRFDLDRAVKVPGRLVREIAQAQSEAVEVWKEAKAASDFGRFAPKLERLVRLRREQAQALLPTLAARPESSARAEAQPDEAAPERAAGGPGGSHPPELYDALLEGYEPGMRVARLEPLFARLVSWLQPVVATLGAAPPPDDSFLRGRFDAERQWAFTLELLEAMGFEGDAGRQDRSVHPFTLGIDPGDVRLTTRIFEEAPLSAIFSTLHEAGHGLYEQGLPDDHRGDVLCAAPSMGIHESQSRLWENLVGRSLPFWRAFLPALARRFPALAGVSPERFHLAANRVERSLVRVDADEVTYNLHIVLRFELELALLRGDLAVADLPGEWNARSRRLLGLAPSRDAEGVLQDIHWAWGEFGYFPTYTIGNLYAASLFAAAARDLGDLEGTIERGDLAPLRRWLREKVHAVGRRREAEEIVRAATGAGLTDADFERYVKGKYGALYGVALG